MHRGEAHLKPVYLALGREGKTAMERARAWVVDMEGLLASGPAFGDPMVITGEADLRQVERSICLDSDALMLTGGGSIPACRKLARLDLPIIIWGPEGFAHASEWDLRGFLESEGAEAYSPLGPSECDKVVRIIGTPARLKRSKALVFGDIPIQSPISSCWDSELIQRRVGVEIEQLPTSLLLQELDKVDIEEGERVFQEWKETIEAIEGPSETEMVEVARLYVALKRLVQRHDADAVTLAWFHKLEWKREGTKGVIPPCLPLAFLLDEGIIAGCEGDLNVLLSMMILNYVSGNAPIMGNIYLHPPLPTVDDRKVPRPEPDLEDIKGNIDKNLITLSHGVIPLSMCDSRFVVEDYHGQERGVTGYCHLVEDEPVTLARMSSDLSKLLVIRGHLRKCVDSVICRFTAWIEVEDVAAVAHNVFSFHHAMVYGDHTEALKAVGRKLGMKVTIV
jgi:L-fucose isomerase-like protein